MGNTVPLSGKPVQRKRGRPPANIRQAQDALRTFFRRGNGFLFDVFDAITIANQTVCVVNNACQRYSSVPAEVHSLVRGDRASYAHQADFLAKHVRDMATWYVAAAGGARGIVDPEQPPDAHEVLNATQEALPTGHPQLRMQTNYVVGVGTLRPHPAVWKLVGSGEPKQIDPLGFDAGKRESLDMAAAKATLAFIMAHGSEGDDRAAVTFSLPRQQRIVHEDLTGGGAATVSLVMHVDRLCLHFVARTCELLLNDPEDRLHPQDREVVQRRRDYAEELLGQMHPIPSLPLPPNPSVADVYAAMFPRLIPVLTLAAYFRSRIAVGGNLRVPHLRMCREPECDSPAFLWSWNGKGPGKPQPPNYCPRCVNPRHRSEDAKAKREARARAKVKGTRKRKRRSRNRGT